MKSNELRIGNWVEFVGNGIQQVEDIMVDHGQYFSILTDYVCIHHEKIKPIPLTEEWLLKFGFEKDESKIDPPETPNGNFWCDWILNGVEIQMPYFEFMFNDGQNSIDIKWLHQLQNLFHSLTGQELEIKEI